MNAEKSECRCCPLPNKSKEACIKRACNHADLPPLLSEPVNPWHIEAGDTIEAGDIHVLIDRIDMETGVFVGQIVKLEDSNKTPGHFGSYISLNHYYQFNVIGHDDGEIIWEIPPEGTDRFHQEGSTGAQFLLYWFKDRLNERDTGFSFDLDS